MLDKITAILSEFTTEEIAIDSKLVNDLGLSSFDLVEIVASFEDAFDIEIADRDIRKLIKVKDVLEYIAEKNYNR